MGLYSSSSEMLPLADYCPSVVKRQSGVVGSAPSRGESHPGEKQSGRCAAFHLLKETWLGVSPHVDSSSHCTATASVTVEDEAALGAGLRKRTPFQTTCGGRGRLTLHWGSSTESSPARALPQRPRCGDGCSTIGGDG